MVGPDRRAAPPQWARAAAARLPAAADGRTTPAKSKLAAGLIAILIPGWGIHNFYLGYTGKGIAQLVLTLTCIGYIFSAHLVDRRGDHDPHREHQHRRQRHSAEGLTCARCRVRD